MLLCKLEDKEGIYRRAQNIVEETGRHVSLGPNCIGKSEILSRKQLGTLGISG